MPLTDSLRDDILAAVPNLRAFAISLSGNADRADDLVQETLLRARTALHRYQMRDGVRYIAFLRKILRNLVRDELRKANVRPARADLGEDLVDGQASPSEVYASRELMQRYDRAFARLPREYQAATFMRLELKLPYAEIARSLDRPSAEAARQLVIRAVRRLAEEFGA